MCAKVLGSMTHWGICAVKESFWHKSSWWTVDTCSQSSCVTFEFGQPRNVLVYVIYASLTSSVAPYIFAETHCTRALPTGKASIHTQKHITSLCRSR
jgi:hypothetical protein